MSLLKPLCALPARLAKASSPLLGALGLSGTAGAQSWAAGVTGNWLNGQNWVGGAAPNGPNADAVIDAAANNTYTVVLGGNARVRTLDMNEGFARLFLPGGARLQIDALLSLRQGEVICNSSVIGGAGPIGTGESALMTFLGDCTADGAITNSGLLSAEPVNPRPAAGDMLTLAGGLTDLGRVTLSTGALNGNPNFAINDMRLTVGGAGIDNRAGATIATLPTPTTNGYGINAVIDNRGTIEILGETFQGGPFTNRGLLKVNRSLSLSDGGDFTLAAGGELQLNQDMQVNGRRFVFEGGAVTGGGAVFIDEGASLRLAAAAGSGRFVATGNTRFLGEINAGVEVTIAGSTLERTPPQPNVSVNAELTIDNGNGVVNRGVLRLAALGGDSGTSTLRQPNNLPITNKAGARIVSDSAFGGFLYGRLVNELGGEVRCTSPTSFIGDAFAAHSNSGWLDCGSPTSFRGDELVNEPGGVLSGGDLDVSACPDGLVNRGTISPSFRSSLTGRLAMTGNLRLTNTSHLTISVVGISPVFTNDSVLVLLGTAQLGGVVDPVFVGSPLPPVGSEYVIMRCDRGFGGTSFAGLSNAGYGGRSFELVYYRDPVDQFPFVTLRVIPAPSAAAALVLAAVVGRARRREGLD